MQRIGSTNRFAKAAVVLGIVLMAAACLPDGAQGDSTEPDASVNRPPALSASGLEIAARLAASDPPLAARLAPQANGLWATIEGATSPGWRGGELGPAYEVGARLPLRAHEALEVGVGRSELYRIRLLQVGAADVALHVDEGRALYANVYPSTDVVFTAEPSRIEWMYVFRDAGAPRELALEAELPSRLADVRETPSGGLTIHDEAGEARLVIPRPYAIDAEGKRRDAEISWEAGRIVVRLDRADLAYPVLLDPAIEVAVWEPRVTPPAARVGAAMAFDAERQRTVLFGGGGLRDTWEWDGSLWTLRATTGPSARKTSMVFDPIRKQTVLFDGVTASDTWTWDGVRWTQVCTSAPCSTTVPPARASHGMAWDGVRNMVLVFGGSSLAGVVNDTWGWNGSAWTRLATTGPTPRELGAMAWDASSSKVVLFGGWGYAPNPAGALGDTWTWNGTSWTQRTTTGPTARHSVAMAHDSLGRVTLFGGGGTSGPFGDTWRWNDPTSSWILVTSSGPSARGEATMAYDSARARIVLFGGGSNAMGDTWEMSGNTWAEIHVAPVPRGNVGLSYDDVSGKTLLFGGLAGLSFLNDLWAYGGTRWNRLCTTAPCMSSAPTGRERYASAFDSLRDRLIIFGGRTGPSVLTNETWEWNGTSWGQVCAGCAIKPGPRWAVAGAFDSRRGRFMIFGGQGSSFNNLAETWAWNGASWTQLCTSGCTSPPKRRDAVMAYDSVRDRVVLFGGQDGPEKNDTWEWNGTTWTQTCTTAPCNQSLPSPRSTASMAFDPVRRKTILFGGSSAGVRSSDVWEWSGTSWTLLGSGGPEAREGAGMSFDTSRQRLVLFGGFTSGQGGANDTWEYHTRGGACDIATTCDTGFCVDGVCCESISCGACQACNLASNPGVCSPVTNADDEDTCFGTNTCDAFGECKKKNGQICSSAAQCASGNCVDGYCCDKACAGGCDVCNVTPGTCTLRAKGVTGASPSCGGYLCDGVNGACPSSCSQDTDCAASHFCATGGICQPRRAAGLSCHTDAGGDCNAAGCRECQAGLFCKDGYCCDGACTGTCQTCAAVPGSCTQVKGADDADTCSGANTCSASGSCLRKLGQSCSTSGQCASGNCVDGVCCNTACSGGCDVCNLTPGTCTVVAQGNPGATPSCGAFVCNGSSPACPTTCGSDADCAGGFYCAADGTCKARKAQGMTCNPQSGADCKTAGCRICESGNCVDGFCCDGACGGACDACNGAALGWPGATNGKCAIAPAGHAGSPVCLAYACNGASSTCATSCASDVECGAGFYCSTNGTCLPQKLQGQACNLATDCKTGDCRECVTGNCVDGYCCNSSCPGQCETCSVTPGICTPRAAGSIGEPSCAPFLCNGVSASCSASCSSDAQCASEHYCHEGTCHPKQDLGGTCGSNHECKSTFCVEGICCNSACNGTCQACRASNKATGTDDGTCGDAKDGLDPHDDCPDDGANSCKRDGTCNGAGACRLYLQGRACGETACIGNVQTGFACDGAGVCLADVTTDCGLFACAAGECASGCTEDKHCAPSAYCDSGSGTCKAKNANGTACDTAQTCESGFCVDGVCCDQACGGQCEACDVGTAKGKCSPVVGKPHGSRPACAGGSGDSGDALCEARSCDGSKSTASCVGYVGADVACRDRSCADGEETFSATCNGQGQCGPAGAIKTRSCEPYACGESSCKDACTTDDDCAAGYACNSSSGKCISGATCDGDHIITAPGQPPTDCRPYKCETGGTCRTSCASIDDCVAGFICDEGNRCAAASYDADAAAESGGNCGCRIVGAENDGPDGRWLALALVGLASTRLRRRGRGDRA